MWDFWVGSPSLTVSASKLVIADGLSATPNPKLPSDFSQDSLWACMFQLVIIILNDELGKGMTGVKDNWVLSCYVECLDSSKSSSNSNNIYLFVRLWTQGEQFTVRRERFTLFQALEVIEETILLGFH